MLYGLARALVALLQALPLRLVARLGRAGGSVFYWLDARHRRVALANLTQCFQAEKSPAEITAIARENFRRIGETYACAIKTTGMSARELRDCVETAGLERLPPVASGTAPTGRVVAIGHFGNFELYAHIGTWAPGYQGATTYRALRQPSLNRLLQRLREQSGCLYFERRNRGADLRQALQRPGLIVGFLADQHAGRSGVRLPFFGRDCACSTAPAVYALRYRRPLHVAICYRVGLARWRIELSDEIPTHREGKPRSVADITRDINQAFEAAIRRDPANWFWVHNRWKPAPRHPARPTARRPTAGSEENPSSPDSTPAGAAPAKNV